MLVASHKDRCQGQFQNPPLISRRHQTSLPYPTCRFALQPGNGLHRFAIEWSEQATFPATLRPYCSSLPEKVADKASDLGIWTAVASSSLSTPLRVDPRFKESLSSAVVEYVEKDWRSTF